MKVSENAKRYLTLFIALFFLYQTKGFIKESIAQVYYLNLGKTNLTKGYVSNIKRNDGMEGLSFEYTIKYELHDMQDKFIEVFSPDSINISSDSSVLVKYSIINGKYATIQSNAH